jgi:hypothetical protein
MQNKVGANRMSIPVRVAIPALLLAGAAGSPLSAATLFSQPGSSRELAVPAALDFRFDAGAGAGLARFDINGFGSLDGDNAWRDTLKVSLNGVDLLSGSWDLGGGSGGNRLDFAPVGSVINATSYGAWNGGLASFELPLDLIGGSNHLQVRYLGGAQGMADESWSLSNLLVSGNTPAPAPALVQLVNSPEPTGALSSPGSLTYEFQSRAGAGHASFEINGFASLDGNNAWSDLFTLSLNGVDILSGTYDLGGGGGNRTDFAPLGSFISAESFGSWNGGIGRFHIPLQLLGGINSLQLRYSGTNQGLADEAWGVSNFQVMGPAGAIPEPTSWALMIAGFGLVGYAMRRRSAKVTA